MSIVIKCMKMPKSCKECKVACEPYLSLDGLLAKLSMSDSVRSDCPFIEVTPHGRLIDADALKQKKKHSTEFAENVVSVAEIDWMPTIVEAENDI